MLAACSSSLVRHWQSTRTKIGRQFASGPFGPFAHLDTAQRARKLSATAIGAKSASAEGRLGDALCATIVMR
jgi:hypothetical protein